MHNYITSIINSYLIIIIIDTWLYSFKYSYQMQIICIESFAYSDRSICTTTLGLCGPGSNGKKVTDLAFLRLWELDPHHHIQLSIILRTLFLVANSGFNLGWMGKSQTTSDLRRSLHISPDIFFPVDFYTWTHQCWPTSKDLHKSARCGHQILSREPARSYGQ